MIRRPTIVLLLSGALLAATATAFAVSMPGSSAPSARDLPRIVAAGPGIADVAAGPATSAPNAVSTAAPNGGTKATHHATDGVARTGSSSRSASAAKPRTPSDPSPTARTSGDPETSGDHDSGDGEHGDSEHEVVKPRLHESDGNEHSRNAD